MTAGDLSELATRVAPVLIFLVMITVVAEIASIAGVFDVAGHWAARAGRHRAWLLWLLVVGLSTVCTVVLSLDTTAVLLTPVVIAVASQTGVSPMPYAMTTLWLANTASLLLPVSNLTNLLAYHRFSALGLDQFGYVALSWRPALAAVLATTMVLGVFFRGELRHRYVISPPQRPHDRPLLIGAAAVCVLLGPAFVLTSVPAIPASVGAVVLVLLLAGRQRARLAEVAVPWATVGLIAVLLIMAELVSQHALLRPVHDLLGGPGDAGLWRAAAGGAIGSNLINNLPAYLALEAGVADEPRRLMALLIGTNAGSIVTIWGSVATVLWRDRCRRAGLVVPLQPLMARSLLCALVVVAGATLALLG